MLGSNLSLYFAGCDHDRVGDLGHAENNRAANLTAKVVHCSQGIAGYVVLSEQKNGNKSCNDKKYLKKKKVAGCTFQDKNGWRALTKNIM